jgi:hypothetical protein
LAVLNISIVLQEGNKISIHPFSLDFSALVDLIIGGGKMMYEVLNIIVLLT